MNKFDFLNQYTILCEYNLDLLYSQPSSFLYRLLKPIKKDIFLPKERIVFYTYSKTDTDLLDHLYQTLLRIDIPDFFIIIVSNQQTTVDYLNNKLNVILVEHAETTISHKKPLFNLNNQFCAYAWAGIHIFPDGTAGPCCDISGKITDAGDFLNIKDHSVTELLDSSWMANLRQQFRDGQKPAACDTCWNRENSGLDSRRTLSEYKLENVYDLIDWENEGQLLYFGGGTGNICNLKCRICSGEFSSSIASEELQQLPHSDRKVSPYHALIESGKWAMDPKFWDQLKQHSTTIKNFELLGGEPLLLKQNIEFLNFLVTSKLSQQTILYITTNGTDISSIIPFADKFKRLEITVSVDNINEKFELERYGAKWDNVANNIQRLISLPTVKIGISTVVSIQNVYYILEFLDWINSINVNSTYFYYISDPDYQSINKLTSTAKKLVLDKLTAIHNHKYQSHIDDIVEIINISPGSDGLEFVKQMKRLDQIRNQDFSKTHPEIAKAMGYQ